MTTLMSVLVGFWEELEDAVFPPCETESVVTLSSVRVVGGEPDAEPVGECVVEVFTKIVTKIVPEFV
jgi:hypothetical protein